MDLLETVHQFFVLLFWYIDERNWSVQSTSSIVKPRKEPEKYKSGDMVVAKFQGKPYRAVIISVKGRPTTIFTCTFLHIYFGYWHECYTLDIYFFLLMLVRVETCINAVDLQYSLYRLTPVSLQYLWTKLNEIS